MVLEVVNGITFLSPLWLREPRLVLVHHVHRDHYVEELGTAGKVAAWLLETAPLRLLYGDARFLTISNASADDIAAHGIARDQIAVGYIGVELDALRARAGAAHARALASLPRQAQALQADRVRARRARGHPRRGPERGRRRRPPRGAGDGDRRARPAATGCTCTATCPRRRSVELLQGSWINLTASSAEGWCLTVMEAAACAHPERGDGGGRPARVDRRRAHRPPGRRARSELGRARERLAADREQLRAAGRAPRSSGLATFTWERTAQQTLDELRGGARAGARGRRPPSLRRRSRPRTRAGPPGWPGR